MVAWELTLHNAEEISYGTILKFYYAWKENEDLRRIAEPQEKKGLNLAD